MYVAAAAESLIIVKLLIREGVDINLPDNVRQTPPSSLLRLPNFLMPRCVCVCVP